MTGPVLLVNNSRWFGGAEVYLEHLLRAQRPGLSFALATRDSAPGRLADTAVDAGLPVTRWRPDPPGLWRLYREMRRAGLVHLNMAWNGDNAHAMALAWLCRRPVVATVHIWVEPRSPWRTRVMGLGYRRFDRVIAVSSEIAGLVTSRLGVPPDAVVVVPNGVPRAEPVVRGQAPGPTVVLGGLGRLAPAKGFDLRIEAVRRLRERGHEVEAVVAGEGDERERLERAAQGLPVRFLGFSADTRAFLADVDVFCLPSRSEGLPLALLEAMMAGTACVAADVGDVAVAVDGAGRVVPPDDVEALVVALEELVVSPGLRAELAQAAHRRAWDRFGIDASVARTAEAYEQAATVTRRGGRRSRAGAGKARLAGVAAPRARGR